MMGHNEDTERICCHLVYNVLRSSKMAERVDAVVAKSGHPRFVSRTHIVEGENQLL